MRVVESTELALGINGLHLEHRCRIRRNDQVRTKINDVLATGASYAMVCAPSATTTPSSNSAIWLIMNPAAGPTPDEPDVIQAPPPPGDPVSSYSNVPVAYIAAFYADAKSKGAQSRTERHDRKAEIRCYLRDPDGYLIEICQATGMLRIYAARHAEHS